MTEPKILFVGPGAIGGSVAAWLAEANAAVTVVAHSETLAALRNSGITLYEFAAPEQTRHTVRVASAARPGEIADADIVVLAVKNYGLEAAARQVREELGDRPLVVSMANGIANQRILPKYFSKVIYCVVAYNARRDAPAVIGYQRRGPLLIGTPDNSLRGEMERVHAAFARVCPAEIVERWQDAVHSKIVINLTNALDALVGRGWKPLSNLPLYQYLLSQSLWEGVRAVRAAGFREYRIPGIPPFALLHAAAVLPGWLTRPVFKSKMSGYAMSSMTQDVALRGAQDTELESITGYIVELAAQHRVPAPFNRAILKLGREKFHPGFTLITCEEVMAAVERETVARIE
jgi:2-dehydropantoate 2-reductase